MFLTNKKKRKLLNFEERVIKTKGFYGEELELKAIKNKMISDYEILIPKENYVLTELVEKDHDGYKIGLIGFEGLLPLPELDPLDHSDNLQERFRSMVASSIAIYIYLDKKFKLRQVEYHYLYKQNAHEFIECDYAKSMLYEYDSDGKNPDILMSTHYIN